MALASQAWKATKGVGSAARRALGPSLLTTGAVGGITGDWNRATGAGLMTGATHMGGDLTSRGLGRLSNQSRAFDDLSSLWKNRGGAAARDLDARLATARANLAAARGGPTVPDNRSDFYRGLDPVIANRYGAKPSAKTLNTQFEALRNAIDPSTGAYDPNRVDPQLRADVDRLHNDLSNAGVDLGAVKAHRGAFDFGANRAPRNIPPDQKRIKTLSDEIADLESQIKTRGEGAGAARGRATELVTPAAIAAGAGSAAAAPEATAELGKNVNEPVVDAATAAINSIADNTTAKPTDWATVGKYVGGIGAAAVLAGLVYKLMQDDDEKEKPKASSGTRRRGRPPGTGRPRGRPRKVV